MTDESDVRILVVDDHPDEARTLADEIGTGAGAFSPDEVRGEDLRTADLVLVDYDLSAWPAASAEAFPAVSPADGLALASVFRSHAMPDYRKGRPVAFALHSSQLERIGDSLSREIREHAIARVHNLEWVFDKKTGAELQPLADRARVLAAATRALPDDWPDEPSDAADVLKALLAWSPQLPGAELAWQQARRCHPPLHELSAATDGLTCLRWLAHRILPYPCFLYDDIHAAMRLGIAPEAFEFLVSESSAAEALATTRYQGVLDGLLGRRWWRAGIDHWLWDLQRHAPGSARGALLAAAAGTGLQTNAIVDPVTVLDENYRPLPQPVGAANAVRIAPDDWPTFADDAWASLELISESPWLRDQVIPDDLPLLEGREQGT